MPSHRAARNEETSNPRLSVGGRSSPGCGVSLKSSNERKSQTRNSRNYLLGERGSIRLVTTVKVLFPLCTTVEVKAIIGPREDGLEPRQKRLPRRVCNRVAGSVLLALPLPLSLSLSLSLSPWNRFEIPGGTGEQVSAFSSWPPLPSSRSSKPLAAVENLG